MKNSNDTGLIGGVEKRQVVIVEYDPTWPGKFNEHTVRLAALRLVSFQPPAASFQLPVFSNEEFKRHGLDRRSRETSGRDRRVRPDVARKVQRTYGQTCRSAACELPASSRQLPATSFQ